MALTQDQWYQKITKFVPSWYFEKGVLSTPVFKAISAIFQQIQQDSDDSQKSTFITQASAPILDLHGDERGKSRLAGELDPSYALRIQKITSHTDRVSIKSAVDALLIFGQCTIQEAPLDSLYCHRNTYCSRNQFTLNYIRNAFLILVPRQVHAPYSFCARSNFCARSTFAGTNTTSDTLYNSIIAVVNSLKAGGVLYGIVELTH